MRRAVLIIFCAVAACRPTFENFCADARCETAADAGVRDRGVDLGTPDLGEPPDPPDAQTEPLIWNAETNEGPRGRDRHVMVYSPKARGVIMTGGGVEGGDLWLWSGYTWTQLDTPPFGRLLDAAGAEDANGDVIIFGGRHDGNGPRLNETWTWDGTTWTQRFSSDVPAGRIFSTMAYDRGRKVTVLFGGVGDQDHILLGDTWEWDGTSWSPKHPERSPEPRGYSAMAYDPEREKILLFGGATDEDEGDIRYGDFYSWDGEIWSEVTTLNTGPAARCDHGMAYDLDRRALIIFSGADSFPYIRDTWQLHKSRWTQIAEGPMPVGVTNPRMDFDRAGRRIVMFGGWNNFSHEHTTYLLEPD